MARRIAVILSQGQSANPAKRRLEEDLVTALMDVPGADVMVVPHLYDLAPQGTGMLALSGIAGDMIVLAWLFPRAAHWTLDRHGIRGIAGPSLLDEDEDEDEEGEGEGDGEEPGEEADGEAKVRVVDAPARANGNPLVCQSESKTLFRAVPCRGYHGPRAVPLRTIQGERDILHAVNERCRRQAMLRDAAWASLTPVDACERRRRLLVPMSSMGDPMCCCAEMGGTYRRRGGVSE